MNLLHRLCNACKYTGIKDLGKPQHASFIERRWMSVKNESEAAAKCKKSDHVDDKFEIIYKPPSNEMLMLSTSFCSISSFACPLFLGNYAYDRFFEQNMELVEQVTTLELCSMGAATIISMFSLSFCRTIPLRIYKHEKEYIAIFPSVIPGMKQQINFQKGDLKERKSTGWFKDLLGNVLPPGFETSKFYTVKKKRIFLTVKPFVTPGHLYEMFPNTPKYARKVKKLTEKSNKMNY